MGRKNSGGFNPMAMMQKAPEAKPIMGLVDSFCDTYKAVRYEDEADEIFTIARIREYFSAWPIPKMPDPLGCYLDELERRGFVTQTTFDGQPAIFVVRWKTSGHMCGSVEEVQAQEDKVRTGAYQVGALLANRKMLYKRDEDIPVDADSDEESETDMDEDYDDEDFGNGCFADEEDEDDEDEDEDEGVGGIRDIRSVTRYGMKEKVAKDKLPY